MAQLASELLIERLADWGVDTVIGLPGDGINGIMEGLRRQSGRVRFFLVHHEEAAAFMATGYAKATGRLGVCLATSGPGAIHLLNGLYDAKLGHFPGLAITGMQQASVLGTGYQQEVHTDRLYADRAEYNLVVDNPAQLPGVVDIAIRTALSRRGVAHLTFPNDVQAADANADPYAHVAPARPPATAPIWLPPQGQARMADLEAAARAGLPVKVVINNSSLGQILWEQMVLGYPEHGVRFPQPVADFAAWATACGGYGAMVSDPKKVRPAISEALAFDGPALVDIDVDPNEPPLPGKVAYDQAKKFAQAFLKGQPHKAAIATTLFKDKIAQAAPMTRVSLPDPVIRRPWPPSVDTRALERALRERVDGEVRFDAGSRGAYSTDASNYRQVPIGVVVPRTVEVPRRPSPCAGSTARRWCPGAAGPAWPGRRATWRWSSTGRSTATTWSRSTRRRGPAWSSLASCWTSSTRGWRRTG